MKTRLVVLLLTLFIGSGSAFSATEQEVDQRLDVLFGSHQDYHDFFDNLQRAVASQNQVKVAAMVSYPLKVGLRGKEKTFRNQDALQKSYDAVFTPALSQVIVNQKYENLFARDQGVVVGDSGQLWFGEVCQDKACKQKQIMITRINQ